MSPFAQTVFEKRYAWGAETWPELARRVSSNVFAAVGAPAALVDACEKLIAARKFMPGGRFLASAGRVDGAHYTSNCYLMRAEDTREGWGRLVDRVMVASMTGGGVGVNYSALREEGAPIRRTGGTSSGPLALMRAVNEVGRAAVAGGSRRAALWAGLAWDHPDVMSFVHAKDWSTEVRALKARDFSFPAALDGTNISVCLDDNFFEAYTHGDGRATEVYWSVVRRMCETGEPGFSVDIGDNFGEDLRNPCCEITSGDDSDVCCIGSINLARIESPAEMGHTVDIATAFLLAGTVYSDVPYTEVNAVRAKNRRLGLGLLGVHEAILRGTGRAILRAGGRYGDIDRIAPLLDMYEMADVHAHAWARLWGLNPPVKTRAIAPTGTIGIVAETTTGIEPVFAKAYRRRYYDRGTWRAQYVVDPTARRLLAEGVPADRIEDAYDLAPDVERRIRFQAAMQECVDHAISSTINLPAWGTEHNHEGTVRAFGETLMRYLPRLRGITAYPDGARGGQPLTPVPLEEALAHEGEILEETVDVCDLRSGSSCGA